MNDISQGCHVDNVQIYSTKLNKIYSELIFSMKNVQKWFTSMKEKSDLKHDVKLGTKGTPL